jgi:hypothetical protein
MGLCEPFFIIIDFIGVLKKPDGKIFHPGESIQVLTLCYLPPGFFHKTAMKNTITNVYEKCPQ